MPATEVLTLRRIAIGSVFAGLIALGLKTLAYAVTGSIALYSDALESIVNVATAVTALIALIYSAKPADANHPYGHYKAEYFSVVIEGVLIVIASLSILREAYFGLTAPPTLAAPLVGLLINGSAATHQRRVGRPPRPRRAPAPFARARRRRQAPPHRRRHLGRRHRRARPVGGHRHCHLDPLLAGVVALNILWSGWTLIRQSVGGLMDEAVSDDLLQRIRKVIADNAVGALEAHDLRTRQAGRATFIDFHLVVPGSMAVSAAHDICDTIERALRSEVADALITIHVEPEEKAKHHGVVVL